MGTPPPQPNWGPSCCLGTKGHRSCPTALRSPGGPGPGLGIPTHGHVAVACVHVCPNPRMYTHGARAPPPGTHTHTVCVYVHTPAHTLACMHALTCTPPCAHTHSMNTHLWCAHTPHTCAHTHSMCTHHACLCTCLHARLHTHTHLHTHPHLHTHTACTHPYAHTYSVHTHLLTPTAQTHTCAHTCSVLSLSHTHLCSHPHVLTHTACTHPQLLTPTCSHLQHAHGHTLAPRPRSHAAPRHPYAHTHSLHTHRTRMRTPCTPVQAGTRTHMHLTSHTPPRSCTLAQPGVGGVPATPPALTLPVVGAGGPEEDVMVVGAEGCGQALLAEAEAVVALRPPLTKLPLAPVQLVPHPQVLAQHEAAPDHVPRLQGLMYPVP